MLTRIALISRYVRCSYLSLILTINIHLGINPENRPIVSFNRIILHDASALKLQQLWHYNWGPLPHDAKCAQPLTAEFVPMIWDCYGNCTDGLPADYAEIWRAAGVRFLLGFNEPDNPSQSNLCHMNTSNSMRPIHFRPWELLRRVHFGRYRRRSAGQYRC